MTIETHRAFISAFGAEHHELQRLVHALGEAVREKVSWNREAAIEVTDLLAELRCHLEHHFAQEEAGGYLEEALTLAPRFSAEAAELLRQHPQMLDKTVSVCKAADRAVNEPAVWAPLKRELTELIKALVAHESAENQIVQRAFNTGRDDLDQ
jgi:hemerythrin